MRSNDETRMTKDEGSSAYEQRLAALRAEALPCPEEYEHFPIVVMDGEREVLRVTFSKPTAACHQRLREIDFFSSPEKGRSHSDYRITWEGETELVLAFFDKGTVSLRAQGLPSAANDMCIWDCFLRSIAREHGYQINSSYERSYGRLAE